MKKKPLQKKFSYINQYRK